MATRRTAWAIYARMSLDRTGAELGIDRQVEDCRELGQRLKLTGEPIVYPDNDISASTGKRRKHYEQLLADIQAGRITKVLVWHTDRLHRRNTELERFIEVAEPRNVAVHAVKAGDLDLTTPSGRMTARILGAVAQQEVEHKAERRARAAIQKAELGLSNGSGRWFGYKPSQVIIREDKSKQYVYALEPEEARAIRAAFKAILSGKTTTSIWREWNRKGFTTQHNGGSWNGTNFRNLITRPSIAGIVTYKGNEVRDADGQPVVAAWPAIVKRDDWEAVQTIIRDPKRKTSPGNQPRHLCSGIAVCGCGAKLRAGKNSIKSKSTGKRRSYTVYTCSVDKAGHSTILKEALEDIVIPKLLVALWRERNAPEPERSEDETDALAELDGELAKAQAGLKRLAAMVAADTLSEEDVRMAAEELRSRIDQINTERDQLTARKADAGIDYATYEAMWSNVKPGRAKINDGRVTGLKASMVASAMRDGDTEEEARESLAAITALSGRFDALSIEQQRALLASRLSVKVLALGRGSRPADRVKVEPAR
jgi:site-specific DNA recombinase